MKVWGGKIVFGNDGRQEVLRSPTPGGGTPPPLPLPTSPSPPLDLSPAQLQYLELVANPLLSVMVQEAAVVCPENLAAFFVQWLLGYLRVPRSLVDPVMSFLKLPAVSRPSSGRSRYSISEDSPEKVRKQGRKRGVDRVVQTSEHGGVSGHATSLGSGRAVGLGTRIPTQHMETQTDAPAAHDRDASNAPDNSGSQSACEVFSPMQSSLHSHAEEEREDEDECDDEVQLAQRPQSAPSVSPPDSPTPESAPSVSPPHSPTPCLKSAENSSSKVKLQRKVSLSAMKHKETIINAGPRDSIVSGGKSKLAWKRSRSVSIFQPPPEIPRDEAFAVVRKVPLFKEFTDADCLALAGMAEVKTFQPDEEIVRYGERHQKVFMILSGECRVSVPTVTGTLKHGDSFGSNALVKTHLASTSTMSAPGAETSRLVTLALSKEHLEMLDLMRKLKNRREGAVNVIARTGTQSCSRKRRPTPARINPGLTCEKTPEDRKLILRAIRANTHFCDWLCLSDKQFETIVDMVRKTVVDTGDDVITIDERGSSFYIVHDGICEVLARSAQTEMHHVSFLRIGDSFGELALLYNSPRKATVRATRRCELWVLNREQFHSVMREKSDTRISEYGKLIETVPLLAERLSPEEKELLSDALEEVFFVKDEEIVRQGEPGEKFYFIFEGVCEIRRGGERAGSLSKGQYLGERWMLHQEPWDATVVCSSDTATLLALDAQSFNLLCGDAFALAEAEPPSDGEEACQSRPETTAAQGSGGLLKPESRSMMVRPSVLTQGQLIDRMIIDQGQIEKSSTRIPFERLQAVGVLGYGAFGTVTLRRDSATDKLFALKALSKGYIKRENLKDHVLNEKKTMQMLDSPFTVVLHQTYRDSQYVYFLMDAALGGELYEIFSKNEEMFGSTTIAQFYTACCALGLEHLHSKKIIYRDLKLENVLLHPDGYALITDLGLAKVVIGKTYTVCGTADYFAPETLRQVGHNRAVDWWALGIMLFIMMAGRSPFDADDVMQIYRNIVKGFKKELFPESFAPELTDCIKAICHKKPEQRLPMGPQGVRHLSDHSWFTGLSFSDVEKKVVAPPFQPPKPDYERMVESLRSGRPLEVEFCENDPETDHGWDQDFDEEQVCISDLS